MLLLVGFGATNLIGYTNAVRTLKETILHNELPLTGSNIYSEVQADLIRPIFIASIMANDTFLKDWLIDGEKNPAQVTRYLDTIRAKYGVFTSFLISDATRRYYHFRGGERHVRPESPEDIWYFRVRDMTKPYEINIDFDQSSNDTVTIFVNYRVLGYDGRFLGVTGVGLSIDSVQRIVARYRTEFHRNVFFVTRTGEVTVTSQDGPRTGTTIGSLPGLSAITPQILAGQEGQFEYQRDGETVLLDTRFIPELGWYVLVEQEQSAATRPLWRSFVTNLWIGSAIILATALVIAWAVSAYHRRLTTLATTDKLTGLGNRQEFDAAMLRLTRPGRRQGRPFAVLLLDIDHFKQINDTLGHLGGDEVIRAVARRTRSVLRTTDLVCRWGGEEFIVVAHDCSAGEAAGVAETLRLAVEEMAVRMPDDGTRVTISIGLTTSRLGDTADLILARVDRALYQAKREGRNCVRIAGPVRAPAAAGAA
ncbi:MAG: GGDEF domain-containing protein [Rhodospirillales bacterium]|nr:GGDEF domain-containing protein [Rhodospirillales bacterium]